MEKQTPREKLLATAADLFYREGFRATGVDAISEASGVGKMTLYRHFPSKDDLIAAYLNDANTQFWAWFESSIALADTPRNKILAFFRSLGELADKPFCHGCPFLNAAVDFPDALHPGHAIALAHKNAVRERFIDLAEQADLVDPVMLADQLMLLMDGAFISIRMYGTQSPASQVSHAVETLLFAYAVQ